MKSVFEPVSPILLRAKKNPLRRIRQKEKVEDVNDTKEKGKNKEWSKMRNKKMKVMVKEGTKIE